MKFIIPILFYFLPFFSSAQLVDDFSDGDFLANPLWYGTTADFNVNTAKQLQLNASVAGTSFLTTPFTVTDSLEWRFFLELSFAPSSSNYARIFLFSDNSDLTQPLNGYYLQFGETGAADAICLYRQSGSSATLLARATDGRVAAAFNVQVKVQLTNGTWKLFAAYNNNQVLNPEFSYSDTITTPLLSAFGIRCTYTSGNVSGFKLDNVYVGRVLNDTISPVLISSTAVNNHTVQFCFSEELTNFTIEDFILNGSNSATGITALGSACYEISFIDNFQNGESNFITYFVQDASGNQDSGSVSFVFYPKGEGAPGDIVINEIYFEPTSDSPLPQTEFIELFNQSDSAINLAGWTLTDNSSTASFPSIDINPGEYKIVVSSSFTGTFANNNIIRLPSFPVLNNDAGDVLKLFSDDQLLIDKVTFNDESYHSSSKSSGGWTIEKINATFPCDDINNWKASESFANGTPGLRNSVAGVFADTSAPYIKTYFITDDTLFISFSESVSNYSLQISGYRISDDSDNTVEIENAGMNENNDLLYLQISEMDSVNYSLEFLQSITDCSGNNLADHKLFFSPTKEATKGDLIINEVLFDGESGVSDFIELYNRSDKYIDLNDFNLIETEKNDFNSIRYSGVITNDHFIIRPYAYLAISKNIKALTESYACSITNNGLLSSRTPDLNSADGSVLLTNNAGEVIDQMSYSLEMHFPLLSVTKGISLERTSVNDKSANESLWHSAATMVRATPGYVNSQLFSGSNDETINVAPYVFSPDNDGRDDIISISGKVRSTGDVISVDIISVDGYPVRKLVAAELSGEFFTINWNGVGDDGITAPSGRYVIMVKGFDLDGKSFAVKKSCLFLRRF